MRYQIFSLPIFILILFAVRFTFAYTTYQTTEEPLKFYFGEPGNVLKGLTITELDKPVSIKATFDNSSDAAISLQLRFRSIETIEFPDAEATENDTLSRSVEVPAKGTQTTEIKIVAKAGTYSAHYPIHLDIEYNLNGEAKKTNIVLTLETKGEAFHTKAQRHEEEKAASISAAKELFVENLAAIKSGKSETEKTQVFQLDGGLTGAVTFGESGFIDGVIGVGNAEKQVQFDGLRVYCKDQPATGTWISQDAQNPDAPPKPQVKEPRTKAQRHEEQWVQEIERDGQLKMLFFSIAKQGPALQFSVNASSDDLINRIEFGPATHHAGNVYFGHGYCISEPESFLIYADGHQLSTSHVGMDFDNGISVLQATSVPPDCFVVRPNEKIYTLSVHPATTITLLPGTMGAMDCAVRFRPICGKVAAPGVKTKAGRFVFDDWEGKLANHRSFIQRAVDYGLTDSLYVVHPWQHWGYDNRLPDIFPPGSQYGTLDDIQQTIKLADKHGMLYALHDNYIDFYPDADEFSFDVTTFNKDGQPKKAWLNGRIQAQSYQFRPDKIQKYLERNLALIVPQLPVSAYYVDVFSSNVPWDFYDRDGNFHSKVETAAAWGKAFDTIRDRLSRANKNFPNAVTISEAGGDWLIGHLDGADCQYMFISTERADFRIGIGCKEWSRVPWFDAVYHTLFSQHGVGYSYRYAAGRDDAQHGIMSDDYITSEILTGHSLMTDNNIRNAVRKYWLAQGLARHLADKDIINVEFVGGDIHRLKITWSDETTVHVNRAEKDWKLEDGTDIVIPPNGYVWGHGLFQSAIYKIDNRIIEYSTSVQKNKTIGYYNARQGETVDFGAVQTKGGFHIENDIEKKTATVTPLPDEPATEISLKISAEAKSVKAFDSDSKELRDVPFKMEDGRVVFTTQKGEFVYRVVW